MITVKQIRKKPHGVFDSNKNTKRTIIITNKRDASTNSKRETENQSAYYEVSHVSGAERNRHSGVYRGRDIDGD